MVNAIESWMPQEESAKGVALYQFTCTMVYAITPLISGLLTSIHWKWAFYLPALVGLIYSLLWWLIASDNPASSKFLSQRELDLINGVGGGGLDKATGERKNRARVSQRNDLPWYFMLKLKVFYSLAVTWSLYCSSSGGFLLLFPTYTDRVLNVPVSEIGAINFYVHIGTMFRMLWPHPMANLLQSSFNISLSAARSVVVFLCAAVVCCTFGYLAFYHDNLVIAISINRFFLTTNDTIVMATVMSMFAHAGVSGLVYSMVNTVGNLSTVLFCWAVGKFLDYTGGTLECWSWVLSVLVLMNILIYFIYAVFCPSEKVEVTLPIKKNVEDGEKQSKEI